MTGWRARILIAYDGSACADAALADLARAGLPADADAIVLSVADVVVPPGVLEAKGAEEFLAPVPEAVKRGWARAEHCLAEARALAARAAGRVGAAFPGWQVTTNACADSPAWAIVKLADDWSPDLIVVGTQGHGLAGGRLILGSVSQRVLYEARCSVRVARDSGRREGPVRLVLGFDGSPDAGAAVATIASRSWPAGSEARVVSVGEFSPAVDPEAATQALGASGLRASVRIKDGSAVHALMEEAESWGAESIFIGAKSRRGVERIMLGSVPLALSARAGCSVEAVRPRTAAD